MICDEAEVFASGLYVACFGLEFFAREVQVQFLTAKFQSMSVDRILLGTTSRMRRVTYTAII